MNRRGALLAVTAVLSVTGCAGSESVAPPAPTPSAASPATVAGPPRVVTLGFAGDVHFQLHLAALLDRPRDALGPIARTLRRADVTMVNLESAITDGGTRDPKELEVPSDRYWFRAPPAALDLLDRAGVDVVTMANNHGADYGADGLADTLRAARRSPLPIVGVGRHRAAALTPYRVRVNGTDLAVFAADASPREGSSTVWEAGPNSPGIASARGPRTLRPLLAAVRATAHDEVVVVYLHWGVPDQACPSRAQVRVARALADAGADVVVGTHAHVLQGAGWLGDTYVAYGLGNFLWYHDHRPDSGVLQLRLEDGRVVSDDWVPAKIQLFGRPIPLGGDARTDAVNRWGALRGCAGLAARPLPASTSASVSPPADLPAYTASVHRIGPALRARMRSTHGPGCPVPWSDLRYLRLSHVGSDGRQHLGELVVAARHAPDVVRVFARLYDARWPIRQMRLASDFAGDDDRSMAADNTSAYNCRRVAGRDSWSDHAFGGAIDINPVQNPYLVDGSVRPADGRSFARLDRSAGASVPAGVIRAGDAVVRAFAAIGWEWGGSWAAPDYQHFAAPSR